MANQDANAFRSLEQPVELVEHANAAAGECGQRRASDPEMRKRPDAEDQARIEDEIDDVRHPQQAHGDGRIARSAEDGVVEEQHDDGAAATQRNTRVAGAFRNDGWGGAHPMKQLRCPDAGRDPHSERNHQAKHNGLHPRDSRGFGIFFADAARHHRGRGQGEAQANREDQRQQRLRQPDSGHCI